MILNHAAVALDRKGRLSKVFESPWLAACGLFALGLATRLALVVWTGSYRDLERSELERVALSVANGTGFANPYAIPTGPTAHVAPLYTLFLALLYKTFGSGISGEVVKQFLSCAVSALQYALLPFTGLAFGLKLRHGILASLLGALLPLKFHTELSGDWEAPYAAAAFIGISLLVLYDWRHRRFSPPAAARQGACWGLLLLLAPMFMPVLGAVLITGGWHFRSDLRKYLRAALITVLAAALVLTPWLVRNYRELGDFVPVRDNFGLEFYLSNRPGAHLLITDNFRGRPETSVHPSFNVAEAAEVRALGETTYNARRLQEGIVAVRSDPGRFLRMTVDRFVWFWMPWSGTPARDVLSDLLSAAALAGLVLYARRRTLPSAFTLAVVVSFPLVYYILECSTRYRYPIEWLLLLMAASALVEGYARYWERPVGSHGRGPKCHDHRCPQIEMRSHRIAAGSVDL
jgi:hypothetical protein